jgi:DNA mismatch endonuclease (patch repair protein)
MSGFVSSGISPDHEVDQSKAVSEVGPLRPPLPSSDAASAVMRGNRRRDTTPEISVRSALYQRGYRYRVDYPIKLKDGIVRPDIVFTRRRLAVFIDGCFWHACPEHGNRPKTNKDYWNEKLRRNLKRDGRNNTLLETGGWHVLRIWEHLAAEDAVAVIESRLEQLSPP